MSLGIFWATLISALPYVVCEVAAGRRPSLTAEVVRPRVRHPGRI